METDFLQAPSKEQNLSFKTFEKEIKRQTKILGLDKGIFSFFGLLETNENFNNSAALLADKNNFPGLEILNIENQDNKVSELEKITHVSILIQYRFAMEAYKRKYQNGQENKSDGMRRIKVPEIAFREAISNALVHRAWDINSNIIVSMYDDRIEILSPGGLLDGLDDKFLNSGVGSHPRSFELDYALIRLKYCNAFGTGLERIRKTYHQTDGNPKFYEKNNSVNVILPATRCGYSDNEARTILNADQMAVFESLDRWITRSTKEIEESTGFSKQKILGILNLFRKMHMIKVISNTRTTRYLKI